MSEIAVNSAEALRAVHEAVGHCDALAAVGDVRSRLDLVRQLEDLVLAAQLGQARVLDSLDVREPSAFTPPWQVRPGVLVVDPQGPPGPNAVTRRRSRRIWRPRSNWSGCGWRTPRP